MKLFPSEQVKISDKVGIEYGLSRNTVARLLRVDKLIADLKRRVDCDEISAMRLIFLILLRRNKKKLKRFFRKTSSKWI